MATRRVMKIAVDKADFEIRWLPFFLDPSLPQEGRDKMQSYRHKFGARAEAIRDTVQSAARDEGIEMPYAGKVSNTMDSHRLAEWCLEEKGWKAQDRLMERLFKAYFEDDETISDPAVLVNAAKESNLDAAEAEVVVKDPTKYREKVISQINEVIDYVSGVPFFILDGKFAVSGAQEADAFQDIIQQVLDKGTVNGASSDAPSD
eukprot:Clim_evm8s225 gene=Clim_evmTU8s225